MPASAENLVPYEQWRTSYLSDGRELTVLALGEDSKPGEHTPVRAGISFAGSSMTWPDAPALQREMLAAPLWRQDVESFLARSLADAAKGRAG